MTIRIDTCKSSVRSMVCTPLNRMRNRIDPPVIVLLYHRVTTLASDPELLAVTPDNFRAQMRYLKETFPVVRFEDDWAKTMKPAVAITFDDGYADNALEALPILEEVGIPATFFVSTGTIGTTQEFWWHELERIMFESRNLPPSFALKAGGLEKIWPTGSIGERQLLYQELVVRMTNADASYRIDCLAQLRRWADAGKSSAGINRAMTLEELQLLAGSSWATIGAHTVTHTQLSSIPPAAQREEIVASKNRLEAWLGREITLFSYPFGKRSQYTKDSIALCREAGFTKAAANFPGQAHRWTDPYQIPRHLVRNWPLETFIAKLGRFWTR